MIYFVRLVCCSSHLEYWVVVFVLKLIIFAIKIKKEIEKRDFSWGVYVELSRKFDFARVLRIFVAKSLKRHVCKWLSATGLYICRGKSPYRYQQCDLFHHFAIFLPFSLRRFFFSSTNFQVSNQYWSICLVGFVFQQPRYVFLLFFCHFFAFLKNFQVWEEIDSEMLFCCLISA